MAAVHAISAACIDYYSEAYVSLCLLFLFFKMDDRKLIDLEKYAEEFKHGVKRATHCLIDWRDPNEYGTGVRAYGYYRKDRKFVVLGGSIIGADLSEEGHRALCHRVFIICLTFFLTMIFVGRGIKKHQQNKGEGIPWDSIVSLPTSLPQNAQQ